MGQARQRGTQSDRLNQAREREREEQRQKKISDTLLDIAIGGRLGTAGKYDNNAALAMAARHHGLDIRVGWT